MTGSDTHTRSVLELLGPSTGGIRRHVTALGSILADQGWAVERKIFLSGQRSVKVLPNLRAEVAVYLVRR